MAPRRERCLARTNQNVIPVCCSPCSEWLWLDSISLNQKLVGRDSPSNCSVSLRMLGLLTLSCSDPPLDPPPLVDWYSPITQTPYKISISHRSVVDRDGTHAASRMYRNVCRSGSRQRSGAMVAPSTGHRPSTNRLRRKALDPGSIRPDHNVHQEWVYNLATPSESKLVWARYEGGRWLESLLDAYPNRKVWVVDADSRVPCANHSLNWNGNQSRIPATQAVIKQEIVPPIIARIPSFAMSLRRPGARLPIPPICIPMELKFEKPHSA